MTKITADHLGRGAFVYIRQSTADQLLNNPESRHRQYGLADRARQLGWTTVELIDDDLGRSGGGVSRPGFERLLAAICAGRVGAVFAIEASRLARNGRDWHTLIEFCGLVGTVIVDEDGVYDPRHPNDRLLLGMKGTMSELELSLFRQRSQEALKQKARRGELFLGVAAGYVRIGRDRIEKDPDQRVQDALRLVFAKFAELRSVRQVHVWLRDDGIALPVACHSAAEGRGIVWRLPLYNTVHNILTNPIYAGAYVFGRTMSKVSVEDGRKRVKRGLRRPQSEWDVLLKDQHEGYITWSEFERNQQVIADNATGKGSATVRGAVRGGELLLAGLLRCGHCGRKLYVGYGGKAGRYYCHGALVNHGTERCISFGGLRADHAVGTEVLRVLSPLGIDAALKVLKARTSDTSAAQRQFDMALHRRASRQRMPVGNMMLSIPPIGWSLASWSAVGTRRCRWRTGSKARLSHLRRGSRRPWARRSGGICCSSAPISSSPGRIRLRPQRPASGSCARRCTRSLCASKAALSR